MADLKTLMTTLRGATPKLVAVDLLFGGESNTVNEENELHVIQPTDQSIYAELAESDLEVTQPKAIAHFIHPEWDNRVGALLNTAITL